MVKSLVATRHVGYKGPGYNQVRTELLTRAKRKVNTRLKPYTELGVKHTGFVAMSDGMKDTGGRPLLNFLTATPKGVRFNKAVDTSGNEKNAQFIADQVADAFEETPGMKHVYLVIMDGASANVNAGQMLEERCACDSSSKIEIVAGATSVVNALMLRCIAQGQCRLCRATTFEHDHLLLCKQSVMITAIGLLSAKPDWAKCVLPRGCSDFHTSPGCTAMRMQWTWSLRIWASWSPLKRHWTAISACYTSSLPMMLCGQPSSKPASTGSSGLVGHAWLIGWHITLHFPTLIFPALSFCLAEMTALSTAHMTRFKSSMMACSVRCRC